MEQNRALATVLTTRNINGTTQALYEWEVTSFVQSEASAGRRRFGLVLKATTNNVDPAVRFNTK